MRRFVFVPIFGSLECGGVNADAAWLNQLHVKVWGYLSPDDQEEIIPIHVEPPVPAVVVGQPIRLLTDEYKVMRDIDEGDTTLPDEVCRALALMALHPEALIPPVSEG